MVPHWHVDLDPPIANLIAEALFAGKEKVAAKLPKKNDPPKIRLNAIAFLRISRSRGGSRTINWTN